MRKPLITQISALGAGASVGVDALGRRLLGRFGSKLGGGVFSRVAPLVGVLTSALGNAATTYAIGRRAEAFAKMGVAPAESLVDAFRAFTGLDERRVWEWSVSATKEALATVGRVTEKVKAMNPFARGENADSDQGESEGAAKRGAKAAKSAKAAKPPRDAATEAAAPGATKRSTAKNTATNKATAKKTGAANKATAAKKRTAGSATAGPAASAKQPRTAKTASTTKAASTSKTAPAAKKPRTRRATGAV